MSSNSAGGRLLVDEPAPGVARLTISNPDKRGALDAAILSRLAAVMGALDARCVILTGEGRTFSAGVDIGGLSGGLGGREEAQPAAEELFAAALAAVAGHPYPTLAALNGHAIGGGLELAMCCDLRVAAVPATFAMPPARLGIVYSPSGIRRFIDAVGAARTRQLFLVGGRIDAATACAWGLVGSVAAAEELAEEALTLAREVAGNAPLALRGNKRVIGALLDGRTGLSDKVERELSELRTESFSSEDFREALRAFADKRTPVWRGR